MSERHEGAANLRQLARWFNELKMDFERIERQLKAEATERRAIIRRLEIVEVELDLEGHPEVANLEEW